MATIKDLHISISDMSDDVLFNFIRNIRSLRRELLPKPVRKARKVTIKLAKKQITINEHLKKIGKSERELLLSKLLKLKKEIT